MSWWSKKAAQPLIFRMSFLHEKPDMEEYLRLHDTLTTNLEKFENGYASINLIGSPEAAAEVRGMESVWSLYEGRIRIAFEFSVDKSKDGKQYAHEWDTKYLGQLLEHRIAFENVARADLGVE